MRKLAPLSFLILLPLITGCDRSTSETGPSSAEVSGTVKIERAEFGLFKIDDGKATFTASNTVPLSVNQAYGWVVKLRTKKERVKWREEFSLPSAPTVWGNLPAGSQEVSADGKTSVLEKEVVPSNGMISNSWSVAEGDPPGRYTIRLTVENEKPIVFEFEVQ